MRVKIKQDAPSGEKFGPNCFDDNIGKTIPLKYAGISVLGTVVKAEVARDGSSATLTFEFEGEG